MNYWKESRDYAYAQDEVRRDFEIVTLTYRGTAKIDLFSSGGIVLKQLSERINNIKSYLILIDITALDFGDSEFLIIESIATFLRNRARAFTAMVALTMNPERRERLNKLLHPNGAINILVYASLNTEMKNYFDKECSRYNIGEFMKTALRICQEDLLKKEYVHTGDSDPEAFLKVTQKAKEENSSWGNQQTAEETQDPEDSSTEYLLPACDDRKIRRLVGGEDEEGIGDDPKIIRFSDLRKRRGK